MAKKELKKTNKNPVAHQSEKQCAQRKYKCLIEEQKEKDEFLKQCKYEIAYCQHYLALQPPGEALE